MHLDQLQSSAFFECFLDDRTGLSTGDLQVHESQKAAIGISMTLIQNAGCKQGIDLGIQAAQHAAVENGDQRDHDEAEQHESCDRAEASGDHPMVQQCEDQHIAHEQQACQHQSDQQIVGLDATAGLIQLETYELVGIDV